jgi:hypothetical protein
MTQYQQPESTLLFLIVIVLVVERFKLSTIVKVIVVSPATQRVPCVPTRMLSVLSLKNVDDGKLKSVPVLVYTFASVLLFQNI